MAESAELSTSLMEPDSTMVTPVPDNSPRAYVAQRKVTLIPPKKPVLVTRQRVAAYARVSRDSEQLMNSLSAQVSYYTDLINQTPEWENAGVYVDAGLTGTSIRARPEFQRLLSDCDAGKIDIVLTKSVSRFARNTVDLLTTVRHLKDLGIEVRFERENIRSLSGDGELMLSIIASFAEGESLSIAENVRWAINKKYKNGEPFVRRKMLGYRWENGRRVLVPKEAETVRYIFDSYIAGMSMEMIARTLREQGVVGINGKPFAMTSVSDILKNEQYTGCLVLQRYYSPRPRKQKVNQGQRDIYFVDNFQPAIITEEQFQQAKAIQERKCHSMTCHPKVPRVHMEKPVFHGRVWCGKCGGKAYWHRSTESLRRGDMTCVYWVCGKKCRKKGCDCKPAKDRELCKAVEELGLKQEEVSRIELFDDVLKISTENGKTKVWSKM